MRSPLVALFSLLLVGCTGCQQDGIVPPGDGGAIDARADRSDAPSDATVLDAAVEDGGGNGWFPSGEWEQPLLGDGCTVKVAKDPNAAVSPWTYTSCAGGPVGCEIAVQDWSPKPYNNNPLILSRQQVSFVGGKAVLTYRRNYENRALVEVVQELDGVRLLAAGASVTAADSCFASLVPASGGVGWVALRTKQKKTVGYYGALSLWTALSTPLGAKLYAGADFGTSASSVNEPSASGDRLFLEVTAPYNVVTIAPLAGGAITFPPTATRAEGMREVPDGVLGISTDTYGIRLVKKDATSTLLYTTPASTVTNDMAYDPKTNKVVWRDVVQGGSGWESGKIYAATYSPNGLSPVLVTKVPSDYDYYQPSFVAYGNYVILPRTNGALRVVRLSDGMGWDVALPPNEKIVDALWVDDDHVWLWDKNGTRVDAIVRLSRSGWGAPTVPPSL
ncbi:hypothetical protein BH09MYX1_BH09MYX1_37580 [soil metagenome]